MVLSFLHPKMLVLLVSLLMATPPSGASGPRDGAPTYLPGGGGKTEKETRYSTFLKRYSQSLRTFYLADCFNPKSQFYKKRDCQAFQQSLSGLRLQVQLTCLNIASSRYHTIVCDNYRKNLYGKLQLTAPKVKLRSAKQVINNPGEKDPPPTSALGPLPAGTAPMSTAIKWFPENNFAIRLGSVSGESAADSISIISLSFMITGAFGIEASVELPPDFIVHDSETSRFTSRESLSLRWSFWGKDSKGNVACDGYPTGYSLYIKGGILEQRVASRVSDALFETIDSSINAHLGVGVVYHFNKRLSFSSEVRVIAPSFSGKAGAAPELHEASATLRVDFGFHFGSPLYLLLTPLLFF
jgi:hypothetical protein